MKKSLILAGLVIVALVTLPFANAFLAPGGTTVRTVNIHDRYSLDLPTYMTKAGDLNFEATLEYKNELKEVYIIVIDESTAELVTVFKELNDYDTTKTPLKNYARAQMESVRGNMSKVTSESAPR